MSAFEVLNKVNVNGHTEKKNGLTYLSWAWAWSEVKKSYPEASYTVYERETEHGPVNYFTDGKTCWVKTGVTIDGQEHIEYLPVMDFKNKSIPLDCVTSTDINKAIQRSLTKACARHGLGLYIYAGEDLPEEETDIAPKKSPGKSLPACKDCGKHITDDFTKSGEPWSAENIAAYSKRRYGDSLCIDCMKKRESSIRSAEKEEHDAAMQRAETV